MFNRSGFNRMPFNRFYTIDIIFSTRMDGEGTLATDAVMEFNAATNMHGDAAIEVDFIREIVSSIQMDGDGSFSVEMLRERLFSAVMDGEGTLNALVKKYHIDTITIDDSFVPGDKIVIDSQKLRVTKNGNIIGYDGDLFDINSGSNTITYSDEETERNILVRVSFRERYLY